MQNNPFDKYYPAPYHSDDYASYVWASEGNMAFDWMDDYALLPSNKKWIVQHLNETSIAVPGFKGKFTLGPEELDGQELVLNEKADARNCTIWYVNDTGHYPVLRVRGWGHLTGCGGFNLDHSEAARIQDGFLEWTLHRLNERDFPEAEELELVDLLFDRTIAEAEFAVMDRLQESQRQEVKTVNKDSIDEVCMFVDSTKGEEHSDFFWRDYSSKPNHNPPKVRRPNNQPWYTGFSTKRKKKK